MSAKNMAPRPNFEGADEKKEAAALLGEFSALLRRLGSPPAQGPRFLAEPEAGAYLESYRANVLAPIELPSIARACQHAARGEWREFLLLDARLGNELLLKPFAEGSQQIGRIHLERLRPLRDERIAQRYLAAVESGAAHGWHTLVYGIMLAVYSWPLRQGLIHYARETMAGLRAASGGVTVPLDEEALRVAVDGAISGLNGSYISNIASP